LKPFKQLTNRRLLPSKSKQEECHDSIGWETL